MGKCKCGVDTGWGGGHRCSACWEKLQFHYLEKVEVIGGFFKGQKGTIRENITNFDGEEMGYKILLDTGDIISINRYNLIKVQ